MKRSTRSSSNADTKSQKQQPKAKTVTKGKKKQDSPPQKSNNMDSSKKSQGKRGKNNRSPSPDPVKKTKTNDAPIKRQPVKTDSTDLKKIVMTGSVPVDPHFVLHSKVSVLVYNGVTYASTLNQSNIANNNNKFYILQVLKADDSDQYYFFTRWGRVGVVGQLAAMGPYSRDVAINQYQAKLRDKTKSGNYRIVQMNYEADEKKDQKQQQNKDTKKKTDEPQIQSTLNSKVQDLIKLIFDMKMMDKQMKEIGYDAKKMPLGKLAKSSIMKGYEALKILMDQVKGARRKHILQAQSSEFYSYIPHDFGFVKMQHFIIDSQKKVKEKLQMLQSLQDIQIFTKILDQGKISSDINQVDNNYLKLNIEISPVDPKSDIYQILIDYVNNTHGVTHDNYSLQVLEIFQVKKQNEISRYTSHIDNKQLLWHGSRLTNYVGILSQGLRIAPPQAPVTGYMFGKGVYFADMVSKSANYCFTNRLNNIGLMLLCQVALGECNQKKYADYYANLLPPGKSSTKGVGKTAPQGGVTWNGVFIPNKKGAPTRIYDSNLLYNQFIVYDVAQIKCRYLFKMKFNYKN